MKDNLYHHYDTLAKILQKMDVTEDFQADHVSIRYTHRTHADWDIYFLSNKTDQYVNSRCRFRLNGGTATLWDPITGKSYKVDNGRFENDRFLLSLKFEPYQSYFLVFDSKNRRVATLNESFFKTVTILTSLDGAWDVCFNPDFGGPKKRVFPILRDWSQHPDDSIKYYSGIATYRKEFVIPETISAEKNSVYIDLGEVKNMARVKINGKEAGVLWTNPWKLDISSLVKKGTNLVEIEVANLWVNRLIGDESLPNDGIEQGKWPAWLTNQQKRTDKRLTFTTYSHYTKNDPLLKSGLIGPVTIKLAK
jgi:hypothetical protein